MPLSIAVEGAEGVDVGRIPCGEVSGVRPAAAVGFEFMVETEAGGKQVVMQAGQVVRQVSAAQLVGRPFLAVLAGSVSEARRAEAERAMVNPGDDDGRGGAVG